MQGRLKNRVFIISFALPRILVPACAKFMKQSRLIKKESDQISNMKVWMGDRDTQNGNRSRKTSASF